MTSENPNTGELKMTNGNVPVLVYRIDTVAKLLGTTVPAVRRMIDNGEIPARRLGRRIVVRPEELQATLDALEHVADSATAAPHGDESE